MTKAVKSCTVRSTRCLLTEYRGHRQEGCVDSINISRWFEQLLSEISADIFGLPLLLQLCERDAEVGSVLLSSAVRFTSHEWSPTTGRPFCYCACTLFCDMLRNTPLTNKQRTQGRRLGLWVKRYMVSGFGLWLLWSSLERGISQFHGLSWSVLKYLGSFNIYGYRSVDWSLQIY